MPTRVLQNEQLPLALVDGDGGIQKFFKALIGCRCRLFHEHVHNGVPPEVFDKALDDQDGIVCHGCSVAGEAITATGTFTFGPTAILRVRIWGKADVLATWSERRFLTMTRHSQHASTS